MKRSWLLLIFLVLIGGAMFSDARAERAVKFFNMLRHTKGQFFGRPFSLLPWQEQIVRDVYGTVNDAGARQYKYVYVEIPKKNGKSELCAVAALFHLFADGEMNGEVYSCASDQEQASLVFDVAVDMIDQSPVLKKRTKAQISLKQLTDTKTGTVYKAISAEAYSKHGYDLSACIFDELHAQPNRKLWDVMTFGAGAARRQPIWWIITTAGDDPDRVSVGWEQHEYAAQIIAGEHQDPTWYPVIYNYQGDDIYNEDNWRQANPSLGVTIQIEGLREDANRAKAKPADERLFRWLRLNQWTTTKLSTWQELSLFDSTVGEWNRTEMLGRDCYMGLDLSSTTDLSGLCLLFPPQGEQLDWRGVWEAWIPEENMLERIKNDKVPYDRWAADGWITPTPGNQIDYTLIEQRILELRRLYNVVELCFDRALAAMLVQRLEKAGMLCVDVPQTYAGLTDPMNQVEVLLKGRSPTPEEIQGDEPVKSITGAPMLSGRMTHEANPVARWCFGNTSIAKNGQGYIKYVKEHKGKTVDRTKRIDLTAAWVIAMARARYYTGSTDLSAAILDGDWGM